MKDNCIGQEVDESENFHIFCTAQVDAKKIFIISQWMQLI
jgi:hypothetical protein